jgi:transposase
MKNKDAPENSPALSLSKSSQIETLRSCVGRRIVANSIVKRASIVLHYLEGTSFRVNAALHDVSVETVRRWVDRWRASPELDSLRERSRSGRNATFGLRETATVLSIISQLPAAFGIVQVRWTQQLVVEVLAQGGITMSRSTVQRILSAQDIDVRTVRYWLWTPKDRPEYIKRRDAICDLYLRMNGLPKDEIVVCFDAKPGIQILSDPKNKGGISFPSSGQPRRVEFEYKRLGTRSFVAAVSPVTGEVLHFDLYSKDRRFDSQETIDFLENLRLKLQKQGYRRIHLVLDNGSTHISKATTSYFEKHAAVFSTYFTPVHASWLNLCENFFSTFSRRYLKHRRYDTVDSFIHSVPLWVEDHNRRANPLRWTYAPHQRAAA